MLYEGRGEMYLLTTGAEKSHRPNRESGPGPIFEKVWTKRGAMPFFSFRRGVSIFPVLQAIKKEGYINCYGTHALTYQPFHSPVTPSLNLMILP